MATKVINLDSLDNLPPSAKAGMAFTKTIHHTSYPSISTSRHEVSQAGRTVLVTGGSAGVGLAIVHSFAAAAAARVILISRRQPILDTAISKLKTEFPATEFLSRSVDADDTAAVEALWTKLADDKILVDVLVLGSAKVPPPHTMLSLGTNEVWGGFIANVRTPLHFTEKFYKQPAREAGRKLAVLYISTGSAHDPVIAGPIPNYSASKNAGTFVLQQIAKDVPVEEMQVLSFHPGLYWTETLQKTGMTREMSPIWDDFSLAGDFAVWATSEEAAFLHGRFVWAYWDVEELKSSPLREKIVNDVQALRVGIHSL